MEFVMRTHLEIDDNLMQQAMRLTGARTQRETVDLALRELVRLRSQRDILKLFGKVEWVGDLDEMRTSKYVSGKPDEPA